MAAGEQTPPEELAPPEGPDSPGGAQDAAGRGIGSAQDVAGLGIGAAKGAAGAARGVAGGAAGAARGAAGGAAGAAKGAAGGAAGAARGAAGGAAGAAKGAAGGAAGAARGVAGVARDTAGGTIGGARQRAERQLATARETASLAAAAAAHKLSLKPRLRGVSHQWAFFVSLGAGAALVLAAHGAREVIAMSIYAFSLSAMLGTSALYHRVTWSPDARRWMRRLDHTMIFVFIAGTYTPFALLVMDGTLADVVLVVVWASAAGGILLNLVWIHAPKWFSAAVYLSTGWVAIVALPQLWEKIGPVGVGLIALGGLLYSAGAVVYARHWPDPRPEVFGYHEIFHALVIGAAAVQYAAVAIYALPDG